MKNMYAALMLAAVVLAGSVAVAGERGDGPPMPPPHGGPGFRMCAPDFGHRGPGPKGAMGGPGSAAWRRAMHPGPAYPPGRKFGEGRHFGGEGMGMGPMARMWEQIQLTDAQKDKMVDVMTDNFRASLIARMKLNDASKKVRDLRKDGAASQDDIVAAHREQGEAQGMLQAQRMKFRDDMRNVLTDEQKAKLDDMRKQGEVRFRDRGDRGEMRFKDRGDRKDRPDRPDRPEPRMMR